MAKFDYDSTLSPMDFQDLSADLIEARDGIQLERFGEGPDQGIDFRFVDSKGGLTVIQCKRLAKAAFPRLYREVSEKELAKIKKLNPQRYILVTSVSMNPARKRKLFEALNPYCVSESDIIGREQIDALLETFEDVLQKNVKLWVPSFSIFSKIINSAIFNRSSNELVSIKKDLKYFVRHLGVPNASKILDEKNVCIIAGIPGIGKTTLAEILILNLARNGFELVKVDSNIQEAHAVWDPDKRQVFYYDDFLGRTSLRPSLEKNEDSSLVSFIKQVKDSKNKKFILTTREYILQDAKELFERLSGKITDIYKYILQIEDLDRETRAKILYNHLYFSEIKTEDLEEIVSDKSYLKIIDHKNYSPRIINAMTIGFYDRYGDQEVSYREIFLKNLDNPEEVWKFPFSKHLDDYDRILILVLWTLSGEALYEDVKSCFESVTRRRAEVGSVAKASELFERSLRKIKNSFISSENQGGVILLKFFNPSVEDFLKIETRRNPGIIFEMIPAMLYFEQTQTCLSLMQILKLKGNGEESIQKLVQKANELLLSSTSRTARYYLSKTKFRPMRGFIHISERLMDYFKMRQLLETLDYDYCANYSIDLFSKIKGNGTYLHWEADRFIDWWMETINQRMGDDLFERLLGSVCLNLTEELDQTSSIYSIGRILKKYGQLVSDKMKEKIESGVNSYIDSSVESDTDDIEDVIGELESISEIFGKDCSYEIDRLSEKLEEKKKQDESENRFTMDDDDRPTPKREMATADIERMFSSLSGAKELGNG